MQSHSMITHTSISIVQLMGSMFKQLIVDRNKFALFLLQRAEFAGW